MKRHAGRLVGTAEAPLIPDGIAASQRMGQECQLRTHASQQTFCSCPGSPKTSRKVNRAKLLAAAERHGLEGIVSSAYRGLDRWCCAIPYLGEVAEHPSH